MPLLASLQTDDEFILTEFPDLGTFKVVEQTRSCYVPIVALDERVDLRKYLPKGKEHYEIWSGRQVELIGTPHKSPYQTYEYNFEICRDEATV